MKTPASAHRDQLPVVFLSADSAFSWTPSLSLGVPNSWLVLSQTSFYLKKCRDHFWRLRHFLVWQVVQHVLETHAEIISMLCLLCTPAWPMNRTWKEPDIFFPLLQAVFFFFWGLLKLDLGSWISAVRRETVQNVKQTWMCIDALNF